MADKSNWRTLARLRRTRTGPDAGIDTGLLVELLDRDIRLDIAERAAATAPDQPGARVWKLVNSPLGLLLLSSVVLTGISQHFARTQAEAAQRAERRASFFKLFTELEYRLNRLENDQDQLNGLEPGDAATERQIGAHARSVIAGTAPDGQSSPEYAKVYLGAIVSQVELTAGLPNNRELDPVLEELTIDDCETAIALSGEVRILRHWVELRAPLVDTGKLPKLPAQVLPQSDQASLVMPDFDRLRGQVGDQARAVTAKLERLRPQCEDAPLPEV